MSLSLRRRLSGRWNRHDRHILLELPLLLIVGHLRGKASGAALIGQEAWFQKPQRDERGLVCRPKQGEMGIRDSTISP